MHYYWTGGGDIQWIWKDSAGETFNGFGRIRRLSFVPHLLQHHTPHPLNLHCIRRRLRSLTHPASSWLWNYLSCLSWHELQLFLFRHCCCCCYCAIGTATSAASRRTSASSPAVPSSSFKILNPSSWLLTYLSVLTWTAVVFVSPLLLLLLLLLITVVIGGDDDRDSNSSGFEENIGRFPGNAFVFVDRSLHQLIVEWLNLWPPAGCWWWCGAAGGDVDATAVIRP